MNEDNITINAPGDGARGTANKGADFKASGAQRHAFQLTINNPADHNYSHREIKRLLIENFKTLCYFCLADEIGEQSTYHTHVFVCFTSRVRFSSVKRRFPEAHIEEALGTVRANIDYIKKRGKWSDSEKAETSVAGTFEEWGTPPVQKGVRKDYEDLYQMIMSGMSDAEIIAANNDFILQVDKISKARAVIMHEKYKNTRRLDLKVTYVCGPTRLGKTRDILDRYGDGNVCKINTYEKDPFEFYELQDVLCFEEFRSQLRISDMLQYLDVYPVALPSRYSNKIACYHYVYMTSNWPLEKQYSEVQKDSPETWKAFLRRIHEVQVYDEARNITVYDSVEKYLHRKETFHPVSPEEECPFGTQEELPFMDGKEAAHGDKR